MTALLFNSSVRMALQCWHIEWIKACQHCNERNEFDGHAQDPAIADIDSLTLFKSVVTIKNPPAMLWTGMLG